ncbi:GDYXXLXY domain-containing protein [Bacillaceae bacterium IKA-2]|nr:GDYXXLXY domain-containing protein [Bacillaceae bacterium IKA-2]
MKHYSVKLSYLLGLSLILAGIIYFFASNWQGFDRFTKIALSILLMLLFYSSSYFVRRFLSNQPFLNQWLLVSGSIIFGVSVGLLGQIYNSHADSYLLFLIWLVPMILFSIFTRYSPFYVNSFVLFHLAFWFYMNPSSIQVVHTDSKLMVMFLAIAAINLFIFTITYFEIVRSAILQNLSLFVAHVVLVGISMFGQEKLFLANLDIFYVILIVYIGLLIGSIYYFGKIKLQKNIITFSILFSSLLFLQKFFSFLTNFGEAGYVIISMSSTIGLVIGSIYVLKWLAKSLKTRDQHEKQYKKIIFLKKIIIIFFTVVASWMGIGAIIAFVSLTFDTFNESFIYLVGIICIGLFFMIKKDIPTVKYTFLTMGLILATVTAFFTNDLFFYLLLSFYLFLLKISPNRGVSMLFYSLFMGMITGKMFVEAYFEFEYFLLGLFIVNLLVYYLAPVQETTRKNGLTLALLSLFGLTFIKEIATLNIIYNFGFFGFVTFLLYASHKHEKRFEQKLSLALWFVFLGFKYYDLAWDLLHKSILMIVLGIIFLLIASYIEQKNTYDTKSAATIFSWKPIFLIILIQLSILSVQVIKSEIILQQGETVILELQPIDPRSLIQGDYVILAYTVGNLEIPNGTDNERVKLVLRKDGTNLYQYAGYYHHHKKWNKDYQPEAEDVIITGRYNGYNRVHFGIESYFVPEGTGLEVEENAKYAIVKVAKDGNALLTKLLNK